MVSPSFTSWGFPRFEVSRQGDPYVAASEVEWGGEDVPDAETDAPADDHTNDRLPNSARFDDPDFLDQLGRFASGQPRHVRTQPSRDAQYAPWPEAVPAVVRAAFEADGIHELWTHQAAAIEQVLAGQHTVVATGTASGKSLTYHVPMLSAALSADRGSGFSSLRGPTSLYLAPTKALAADQRNRLDALHIPGARVATLDGDTPPDERRWIREHANIVLSNPDLLHHTLLPGHERWSMFWRNLQIVVLDECHIYRGVFGAHTANLIRRLRRIAHRYGAEPTFVLTSATSGAPAEHAHALTGLNVTPLTDEGSPRPRSHVVLWEPGEQPQTDASARTDSAETADEPSDAGLPAKRRSAVAETADLLAQLVTQGTQSLAFARSRVGVEVIADMARQQLQLSGHPRDWVAAYRGGYLPEERRELEHSLRTGALRGLAATSALELGIDISGLDAVLITGWPGTVASLRQQMGRAGRGEHDALALFVAADDPLDTYFIAHPDVFFGQSVEATVMDELNPHVLAPQLACAAAELPLTEADETFFSPAMWPLVDAMTERKILRKRPRGWYWARDDRPGDHVSLRDSGEQDVRIVDARTGTVLGTVDGARAPGTVHAGAVYLHQGRSFIVRELDLADGSAHVVAGNPGWSTMAKSTSEFRIVQSEKSERWGATELAYGTIRVTNQVTSFLRKLPSGKVIGEHPLEMPARELVTKGVWWTLPEDELLAAGLSPADLPGSLHAAEHCSIGLISLVAQGDRWDIGGVSTALHPDTGQPTVVVYDALPGGSGFAARAFDQATTWLQATRDTIASCRCESGCPACIQSPKCGNGNHPLDKAGALMVLDLVLQHAPRDRSLPRPEIADSSKHRSRTA